ncbi:hypothetical protein LOTGIDRAFT_157925 [Lottia gigantea]|uniref:Dynactin subunit 3 n=1 Tax=Lottia gigantea TaxID=225164 RepID=V4A9H3_LOTGI|nr:hypothetical protein LOTGIDRAFT_157925 [Lottia gigantea]ESP00644.1 hypothetical protein LOTGIDRAFT_157925 [Lottia gigantea]
MADSEQLDTLEKTIEGLEQIVFGCVEKDAHYPKVSETKVQCIDSLLEINNKISTSVTGKKRIPKAFTKLNELKLSLDPAYTDEMTLSESAKIDTVLAEEEFLREQANRLDTMQQLEEMISSEHIKAVPKFSGKLHELSQVQIKQQDQTALITEEVQQALDSYNTIITLLSKQFAKWDEIVTNAEIAAQKK